MIEFNPDGSLKLPESLSRQLQEKENKLKKERCVLIKKEAVSLVAPKSCIMHITLSEAFPDSRFVDTLYGYFKGKAQVPAKITKISDRQFDVEIGTAFSRCSDCNMLVRQFREFLTGNVIEEKGSCTYKDTFRQNFCYEDYFN